jgi:glycosyltransferase involved in cell wall biosynthesis
VWEKLNRQCVRTADLKFFTQREYAREMLGNSDLGHVIQASWIDEDNVLDREVATQLWRTKANDTPLRLLFAGRLISAKGIPLLLSTLADTSLFVHVDIIGSGDLSGLVRDAARRSDRVRLLKPVPYGPAFFALLREYHAVIVPSISDEQPRIVYDAYSQAVPILATSTSGLRDCVIDQETGYLARPGCEESLSNIIHRANENRTRLEKMGIHALDVAKRFTHREMHRRRWRLISQRLSIVPKVP